MLTYCNFIYVPSTTQMKEKKTQQKKLQAVRASFDAHSIYHRVHFVIEI